MKNQSVNENCKINVCTNHTGKMELMQSISTSPLSNKLCMERAKVKDSICYHCYSQRMNKMYKGLAKKLIENYSILTERVLDKSELPLLNCLYFRFESFGDLANENQFINYLNICSKNPNVNFAIWTKNPHIMKNVFAMGYTKPSNLIIIISNMSLNPTKESINFFFRNYEFCDKVFNVYDKTQAKEEIINCGAKKCINCLQCYKHNDIRVINEKLK